MNPMMGNIGYLRARLDYYHKIIDEVIISRQHPCTGLLPASTSITEHGNYTDAWVRDNVYSILCVWGLALAYRKVDDERGRAYELEQCVVKLMRALLFCMMRQASKVEKFKFSQTPEHALHAKYNTSTCDTVVGDYEWGHLQIDATSLFLLFLAQMTASGLKIIFTMDEVDFVQNLVFYIERAYRTPDYGVWERGQKNNQGSTELNSSSIGLALAALEAVNGLNLFGSKGGPSTVIHVLPDEITRNHAVLESFLPRESKSKEIDASLLSVISFPAFAVSDPEVIRRTREDILNKLGGKYGCKRFLRDGHQTAVENKGRLYYELHELMIFENIECEWPLFFTYLVLDGIFREDKQQVAKYKEMLESILVPSEIGAEKLQVKLVPELYYVELDKVDAERANPHSQTRVPNTNVPLVWAQSLYLLGGMLDEGLLSLGEIDPLNRRQNRQRGGDTMIQIVLIAEDEELQAKLLTLGLETQTPKQIEPIKVCPNQALSDTYFSLGQNGKLGLTGRPRRPVGTLSVCRVYRIEGKIYMFTPYFMDRSSFYLSADNEYLVSLLRNQLKFVKNNWSLTGRPTMCIMLTHSMWDGNQTQEPLLELMMQLKTGLCDDVRTRVGRMQELINTSCLVNMHFLSNKTNFSVSSITPYEQLNEKQKPKLRLHPANPTLAQQLHKINKKYCSSEQLNVILASVGQGSNATPMDEAKLTSLVRVNSTNVEHATRQLNGSQNLFEQAEILCYLAATKGINFDCGIGTVDNLMEEVYHKATRLKQWSIVRKCAGYQQKVVDRLTICILDILIRQKQITIGAPPNEFVISEPISPDTVKKLIYTYCIQDPREAPLVQEIIVGLDSIFGAQPRLFDGILRVRTHFVIVALREELAREMKCKNKKPAHVMEHLFQLSPFEIKSLLATVLLAHGETESVLVDKELIGKIEKDTQITQELKITLKSAGEQDGNFASIEVGPHRHIEFSAVGLNVVVIDTHGKIAALLSFNTSTSQDDSEAFARFLNQQDPNHIIAITILGDGVNSLTEVAKSACESLGSRCIRQLSPNDSWCLVGKIGQLIHEHHSPVGCGPAECKDLVLPGMFIQLDVFQKTPTCGKWLRRRQIDAAVNRYLQAPFCIITRNSRVPQDFYPRVWNVLSKSKGIQVGSKILPRDPTVLEMTRMEFNFALSVESLLENFQNSVDRQMGVEILMVISKIEDRNPEVTLSVNIDLENLINEAAKLCWAKWCPDRAHLFEQEKEAAKKLLYDLPQEGEDGTLQYVALAAMRILPYNIEATSQCVVS